MNPRYKIFADEWLTGEHTGKPFHATRSYEYAGYALSPSNPGANASKLLRHPDVQAYIKQRMDEHAMSATEVLLRFTSIARSEVGDVVVKDPVSQRLVIDPDAVIANKSFIKSFGFDSNGNPKIEFHDAVAALQNIARVRGMLKDGLEISGPGGGAVNMKIQFVDPKGETFHPAGEEEEVEVEDFSELDNELIVLFPDEPADA